MHSLPGRGEDSMDNSSKERTLKLFRIANILLLAVYILAVVFSFLKKNSSEKEDSILKESQKEKIKFIEISDGNKSHLNFERKGILWTVTDSHEQNPTIAIADSTLLNALLENICEKSTMTKKAEKKSSLVPFELSDEQATRITVRDIKGSVLTDFYLGKIDVHTRNTALRYSDENTVWEKKFTAETSAEINAWAEHLIYPEFFSEKNTGLTRGRLTKLRPSDNAKPDVVLKKDFLEDSKIILKIYSTGEDYLVSPEFSAGSSFNPESKEALNFLNFYYTISSYTFDRLVAEGKK